MTFQPPDWWKVPWVGEWKAEIVSGPVTVVARGPATTTWPPPPDVCTSTCRVCGGDIFQQECPTGDWWIHRRHPKNGHDADAT